MSNDIAAIRKNYAQSSLTEDSIEKDPILQFAKWWNEAVNSSIDEVNAMTLATSSVDGLPAARIVLLKGFSEKGFMFFTNYESFKGRQLAENPKACLVFFWKELERQVRITGLVEKATDQQNDEYFQSRPFGSRVGAMVSPQSTIIKDREWLESLYQQKEQELNGQAFARPSHWGGYLVKPVLVEFWQGRVSRLHDRIEYHLQDDGKWKTERLAP